MSAPHALLYFAIPLVLHGCEGLYMGRIEDMGDVLGITEKTGWRGKAKSVGYIIAGLGFGVVASLLWLGIVK